MEKQKVFGIGLSRTGTSSLNAALEMLGYRSIHFPLIMENTSLGARLKYRLNKWAKELGAKQPLYRDFVLNTGNSLRFRAPSTHSFDAMTDLPVTRFYKELDAAFPNSKFVLTLRDESSWLASCSKFFAEGNHPFFKWIQVNVDMFGTQNFDESLFRSAYQKHKTEVLNYFQDRPADLLILDIPSGDGWDKLCPFLGLAVPNIPFPNENKARN